VRARNRTHTDSPCPSGPNWACTKKGADLYSRSLRLAWFRSEMQRRRESRKWLLAPVEARLKSAFGPGHERFRKEPHPLRRLSHEPGTPDRVDSGCSLLLFGLRSDRSRTSRRPLRHSALTPSVPSRRRHPQPAAIRVSRLCSHNLAAVFERAPQNTVTKPLSVAPCSTLCYFHLLAAPTFQHCKSLVQSHLHCSARALFVFEVVPCGNPVEDRFGQHCTTASLEKWLTTSTPWNSG
jgi:hypothetical protein